MIPDTKWQQILFAMCSGFNVQVLLYIETQHHKTRTNGNIILSHSFFSFPLSKTTDPFTYPSGNKISFLLWSIFKSLFLRMHFHFTFFSLNFCLRKQTSLALANRRRVHMKAVICKWPFSIYCQKYHSYLRTLPS